jgi:hypothetical protein
MDLQAVDSDHHRMPSITVERSYSASLTNVSAKFGSKELLAARRSILERASSEYHGAAVRIRWTVDTDAVTLSATTTEARARHHQLDVRLLDALQSDLETAFNDYCNAVTASANHLALFDSTLRMADSIYANAGMVPRVSRLSPSHVFQLATSTVTIEVNRAIAAAARSSSRLARYMHHAISDYYSRRGQRVPEPMRFRAVAVTIARSRTGVRIASSGTVAEDVARAVLSVPRIQASVRSIDTWPPASAPFWSVGTLVLAALAVVEAPTRITNGILAMTVVLLLAVAAAAIALSWRGGAAIWKTALGLAPACILILFAVFFGYHMNGPRPDVVGVASPPRMIDAFLVSIGIASTGGFLDVKLSQLGVRVAALVEMLLMVTVAGGSLYTAGHEAWSKLTEALRSAE